MHRSVFAVIGIIAMAAAPAVSQTPGSGNPDDERFVSVIKPDEGRSRQAGPGMAEKTFIDARNEPLRNVLMMLTQTTGYNIVTTKDSVGSIRVTALLRDVHWRDILDHLAVKYKLTVDYSQETRGIITVDKPQQITYNFTGAEIKEVINMIARQADANIILDDKISGTVTMRLRDIPWRTALELVVKTTQQELAIVEDTDNNILRIVPAAKISQEMETRIFRLSYVQPLGKSWSTQLKGASIRATATESGIMDVLKMVATDGAKNISVDGRSNSLIVKDTPVHLDAMQRIIRELDVAPKQIHVAVRIVSLNNSDAEALGIRWEAGSGDVSGAGFGLTQTFPSAVTTGFPYMFAGSERLTDTLLSRYALVAMDTDGVATTTNYNDVRTVRASGRPYMDVVAPSNVSLGRMSFLNTQLVLEMIREKTSGSIIQTPDIITIDNEGAYLHIGNTLRFAEQTTVTTEGGGTSSGFQEANGSPVKTGVTLTILPHVTGPDRNILMSILPEINELVQMRTFTGPDGTQLSLPETSDTTMTTTMLTRNKETVVIGGLKTERKTENNYVVPFLGDLPVIGWLFRDNVKSENVSKVYIFVTPTIIDFNDRNRFERELSRIREEFSRPFVAQSNTELPY